MMTSTTIGQNAWFDLELEMHIIERLPKKNFACSEFSYSSLTELQRVQESQELCILSRFVKGRLQKLN